MPAPIEIQVKGLCKAFDGNRVLRGVDLDIQSGEIVAVVGGSGCGKTVLLNHILGQLEPDAGSVCVADHAQPGTPLVDLAEIEPEARDRLHTYWGVVFQRNALFSGSVFDNFALWLKEIKNLEDDEIIPLAYAALDAVDLPATADFLETAVESLSGGMSKRLAVARALSMEPVVLFYDEPTTGLDPTSASQVQDLILTTHELSGPAQRVRTTVIITHDKDLLTRLCPRTVMLHEGRVFFDGPFEDFKASRSPVIRPYFDLMPVLHQRAVPSP